MAITYDALDVTTQGSTPPDMFMFKVNKLGPHCIPGNEAHTIGKRTVDNILECFLGNKIRNTGILA